MHARPHARPPAARHPADWHVTDARMPAHSHAQTHRFMHATYCWYLCAAYKVNCQVMKLQQQLIAEQHMRTGIEGAMAHEIKTRKGMQPIYPWPAGSRHGNVYRQYSRSPPGCIVSIPLGCTEPSQDIVYPTMACRGYIGHMALRTRPRPSHEYESYRASANYC